MKYKFKEQDNIINILEGDDVIAKYRIDKHWEQKNMSIILKLVFWFIVKLYLLLLYFFYRELLIKINSAGFIGMDIL